MSALGQVARLPDVRRILLGWGASITGEVAGTVALLVYAYGEGGAALVAAYGVARTLPGAIVAPLVTGLSSRVRLDRLLRRVTWTRAALLAAAALAAGTDLPAAVVIALAGASSSLAGTFRPLQAAALPWLARTPGELTAANVAATVMENSGTLVGPLLAAVLLAVSNSVTAMAAASFCLGVAALSLLRLEVSDHRQHQLPEASTWVRGTVDGARAFANMGGPGGLPVLVFAQTFLRGALMVLVVVLALDVLDLGESSVGWLNAAVGLGGILGAAVAATLVPLSRLGRSFIVGVALWGLPLVALAVAPSAPTAVVALMVVGAGNMIEDCSMFTLMPRVISTRLVGPALGALEMTAFAGLGAGSVAAPALVDWLGVRGALAALGAVVALLAAAYAVPFARLDRGMAQPGPEIGLLRQHPIFELLPLASVEHLASVLQPGSYEEGEVVIREGEPGDRFHLVQSGSASVSVRGAEMRTLGPGDGFGEIALLRDLPRTATITAREPLTTLALTRGEFLAAVAGHRGSAAASEAAVTQRLASDPPRPAA